MPSGQIEWQEGDTLAVQIFENRVYRLCELIEEIVVTNPQSLLSPVLREILKDEARKVNRMRQLMRNKLRVDNLGQPLAELMPELGPQK